MVTYLLIGAHIVADWERYYTPFIACASIPIGCGVDGIFKTIRLLTRRLYGRIMAKK
jgi:hypothetical protein